MKKGIIFCRVSSKEQADEGYSLDAQRRLLESAAQRDDISVEQTFAIPESARGKQERKLFNEMMAFLYQHPHIKVVLCEKVDRITRNFKDAVQLNDWLEADGERSLHFVKESLIVHKDSKSQEKFMFDIKVVLAKQYSNNLSEEAKKGLDEKAEQGWYPGNKKRGYKTIGDTGRRIWVMDDSPQSELPYIKRLFELYDTGEHTTLSASKKLFEEGWRTEDGKRQGKTTIHDILRDCFYCGEFVWKKQHHTENVKHPPLISKELFYSVQEKLHRKVSGKYRKHSYLLKNNMICGECGRSVCGQTQKGHNYYRCTLHGTNCTQRSFTKEEDAEENVLEILDSLKVDKPQTLEWLRAALKESNASESEYHLQVMDGLNDDYKNCQQKLSKLYDEKMDGKITEQFYRQKFNQYNTEQESILDAIKKNKDANILYRELGVLIFELAQHGREVYETKATPEEKRSLLYFVFSNLKLKDKKLVPEYKNGFQLIAAHAKSQDWLGMLTLIRTYSLPVWARA